MRLLKYEDSILSSLDCSFDIDNRGSLRNKGSMKKKKKSERGKTGTTIALTTPTSFSSHFFSLFFKICFQNAKRGTEDS